MDAPDTRNAFSLADRLFDQNTHDELLRSTVRITRLVFGAAAASVFLYDREHDRLVFEASSGAGEDRLIGVTIPADHGIAGWVLNTGETLTVRELGTDDRFDRSFAEGTGYVPDEIMATPLEVGKEPIGVIEVLDPKIEHLGEIAALDLLAELAGHACAAVSLLIAARSLEPVLRDAPRAAPMARLEALLGRRDGREVDAFLTALADLLAERG